MSAWTIQPFPWTQEWWAKAQEDIRLLASVTQVGPRDYSHEPTPIYNELVVEIAAGFDTDARIAYAAGNHPGYARYGMLSDRIRRGVVPPWTRLEEL